MKQHCWHSEVMQSLEFPQKDRQICCFCGGRRCGQTVNSGKHGTFLPSYEYDVYVYSEPTRECIEREPPPYEPSEVVVVNHAEGE